MDIFWTVVLVVLVVIFIIGLIRVIFAPVDNLLDLFFQLWLIDLLIDLIGAIFEAISNIWDD